MMVRNEDIAGSGPSFDRASSIVNELRNHLHEGTWFEFKSSLDKPEKIGEYISGLANSAALAGVEHGYLVWGISDDDHRITGTTFDPEITKAGNEALHPWLSKMLSPTPGFRFIPLTLEGERIVLLEIDAAHQVPVTFKQLAYIRIGSHLKKLNDHPDEMLHLFRILDHTPIELRSAKENVTLTEALGLLDVSSYFTLQGDQLPLSNEAAIGEYFERDQLIHREQDGSYTVTILGALLFAHDLRDFPDLERKAPRVITYADNSKLNAMRDKTFYAGYATGFERLIDYIEGQLPAGERIESAIRENYSVYPIQAMRELAANALIHQDLSVRGATPLIEIYTQRIEFSNPGEPLVDVQRIIDAPPRTRNEKTAAMMRRCNIAEERGSGWDRIMSAIENAQLPAPDVRSVEGSTVITVHGPKPLKDMDTNERIQAVYLYAGRKNMQYRPFWAAGSETGQSLFSF